MDSDVTPSGLDPVEPIAEDFLRRCRRGDRPTAAEYAARYPEYAGRILELFPALALLEGLKPAPEDDAGLSDASAGRRAPAVVGDGPRRIGDYTLLRELGRGGMGIVYEAEHESLKSRMALKVMNPRLRAEGSYRRRFQTEARSAAKLHHTNIVPVFDYGEHEGVCYYAMQCIEGVGLDRVLDDVRRLRAGVAGDTGSEAGDAGRGTMIDVAEGKLPTISRGLLTGRFATSPTAFLVAGSDEAETAAIDGSAPLAISGVPVAADRAGLARSGNGVGAANSSFAGQPEAIYFREIARLGAQVADALDYAHRQGVIHRDIKPPNLLLDTQGNVWVTDFGLAKLVEGDEKSQSRDVVGTLRFIAPERFRGVTNPPGDVYSLGATLYELLTLKPAFAELDQARLMDQITHQPPAPLRHHDHRIPRDLETLVLKALAKDPKDRFAAAGELADELRRYLESRPILSRPVGPVERLWRWCKRSPGPAAAALVTAILAISMTIAALIFHNQRDQISRALVQARDSEARAIEAGIDAQMKLLEALQSRARAGRFSRRVGQRLNSLGALKEAAAIAAELGLPRERFDLLRDEAIACMALPDLESTGRVVTKPVGVIASVFDSTMTRYALRFRDGTVSVRLVADDHEVASFHAGAAWTTWVFDFSRDGRYLATADQPGYLLRVWDVDRGVLTVSAPGPEAAQARFSPDSRRIVVARKAKLLDYELATGRQTRAWPVKANDLAFRPDGAQIAAVDNESKPPVCRILDADSGRVVQTFSLRAGATWIAWDPSGHTLATTCRDTKIDLWDTTTGNRRATFEGHTNVGLAASFHPAGTLLASSGFDGQLWLWDSVVGRPVLSLSNRSQVPNFSQDGRIVVSQADLLIPFEVHPALEYRTLAHAFGEPMRYELASVRGDGRVLAVGTERGVVLWDLARGTELPFLPIGPCRNLLFEASGDLITGGPRGVERWPIRLEPTLGEFRIGPPGRLPLPAGLSGIAEDRQGRIVALANSKYAHVATPGRTFKVGPLDDCRSVAVSPDGYWLATGNHGTSGAQVWRAGDGAPVKDLPVEGLVGVAFSPDGKWLMTSPSPCTLWEVGTWRARWQVRGEGRCFSPDSHQSLVVVAGWDKVLQLVETGSGRVVARLESPDSCSARFATFSPDGSRLVVTTVDCPAVHVWDLRAIRKRLVEMGLDWDAAAYSDDDPAAPSAPILPPLLAYDFECAMAATDTMARQGRWEEAAAAFDRGFPDGAPDRPDHLFEQAVLRLAVGDVAGYRSSCRRMLDVGRDKDAHRWLEFAAHACVLAPEGPADEMQALQLAQDRASADPGPFSEHVLGLALYRAGRFAAAGDRLHASLDRDPEWEYHPLDWLVLAMADQRLGRTVTARLWLQRAESWVADQLRDRPGGADRAAPENWPLWRDAMLLHLLLREARTVVHAGLPELPADVFAPSQ